MELFTSYLNFDRSVIGEMEGDLDILTFKKNQTVYMEGSTPLGIYILTEGSILISKIGSQGKEQVLKILNEGDIMGGTDLILGKKYGSSAKAVTSSKVLFIPKSRFFDLLNNDEKLIQQLILQFAKEIQTLEAKTVSLAFKPVRGRLADTLLLLNKKNGDKISKITLSRTEIAGFTGTVKETVNRLLSEFHKEKLVTMSRKEICIIDQDHLLRISKMYE